MVARGPANPSCVSGFDILFSVKQRRSDLQHMAKRLKLCPSVDRSTTSYFFGISEATYAMYMALSSSWGNFMGPRSTIYTYLEKYSSSPWDPTIGNFFVHHRSCGRIGRLNCCYFSPQCRTATGAVAIFSRISDKDERFLVAQAPQMWLLAPPWVDEMFSGYCDENPILGQSLGLSDIAQLFRCVRISITISIRGLVRRLVGWSVCW